jgi:hypothetical protein
MLLVPLIQLVRKLFPEPLDIVLNTSRVRVVFEGINGILVTQSGHARKVPILFC